MQERRTNVGPRDGAAAPHEARHVLRIPHPRLLTVNVSTPFNAQGLPAARMRNLDSHRHCYRCTGPLPPYNANVPLRMDLTARHPRPTLPPSRPHDVALDPPPFVPRAGVVSCRTRLRHHPCSRIEEGAYPPSHGDSSGGDDARRTTADRL